MRNILTKDQKAQAFCRGISPEHREPRSGRYAGCRKRTGENCWRSAKSVVVRLGQKLEMVLAHRYRPLPAQLADFGGKRASLDAEKIGKRLAVERDLELQRIVADRLPAQIGHEPPLGRAVRKNRYLPAEHHRLFGQVHRQIPEKSQMRGVRCHASGKNARHLEKEHLRFALRLHRHTKPLDPCDGKGFYQISVFVGITT